MHQEEAVLPQEAHLPEAAMELLPGAEVHLPVILHGQAEAIPADAAVDIIEKKDQITRSLLLQV